jgi:SHS2 domain-containing protein
MAIYLMAVYSDPAHEQWLRAAWAKTGKKLDMGKSCIRFKRLEDLALDVLGEAIRRVPAQTFITRYTEILQSTRKGAKASAKPTAKKTAAKVATKKTTAKATTTKVSAKKTAAKKTAAKKTAAKTTAAKKPTKRT